MSPFLDRYKFTFFLLKAGQKQFAYVVIPIASAFSSAYGDPRLRHKWVEALYYVMVTAAKMVEGHFRPRSMTGT